MTDFWKIIAESNVLNFLVLVVIFWFVFSKIQIGNIFLSLKKNIENEVNNSIEKKKISEDKLHEAQSLMANTDIDVQNIISNSENSAKIMAENIIKQADTQIEIIENNAKKVIENDIQKTKRVLTKETAKASISVLTNKIKKSLDENSDIHQKYIDEAIDKLDSLNPEDLKI